MDWWRERSGREQALIAIMAVLLLVVMAWLGVMRPIADARDGAIARLATAEAALADVRAMAPSIHAAQSIPRPVGTLIERISERVRAAGLTTEPLQSGSNGEVTLHIAAVRPAIILGWIADLERRDAIIVQQLAITRNDDHSVAVDITLTGAGA